MEATTSSLVVQYPTVIVGFAAYGVISAILTIFVLGVKWGGRTRKPKQIK